MLMIVVWEERWSGKGLFSPKGSRKLARKEREREWLSIYKEEKLGIAKHAFRCLGHGYQRLATSLSNIGGTNAPSKKKKKKKCNFKKKKWQSLGEKEYLHSKLQL